MAKRVVTLSLADDVVAVLHQQGKGNMSVAVERAVRSYFKGVTTDDEIRDLCGKLWALELDKKDTATRAWPIYSRLSKLRPSTTTKAEYEDTMLKLKGVLHIEDGEEVIGAKG